MSGGIRPAVPDPGRGKQVAACRVGLLAADGLERRRVLNALERDGIAVHDGAAHTPAEVDLVVVVGGDGDVGPTEMHDGSSWVDGVPYILVQQDVDRTSVERALAAGAMGVVRERDVDDRLAATVHAAAVGQLCIPSEHAEAVARPLLSPREKQVMSMVVLGFTNREIANKLHVTETTVKSHLSSAYRKLQVRSRHEATALILSDQSLGLGILTLAGDRTAD